jgi:hypothetical protein
LALDFDKLNQYFFLFATLIPGAFTAIVIVGSGFTQVDLGIAVLIACVILPILDHMRADVVKGSNPIRRIKSWLFMITSTGVMAMLVTASVSVYNPLTWIGVLVIFGIVWYAVVQFRKTYERDLDPYDRMYLASGHVLGFLVPMIAYVVVAAVGADSLLRVGSPAIPALFLIIGWLGILLLVLLGKTEIISKKLLTFDPSTIQQQGHPGRFARAIQDLFPFLVLSILGMAAESRINTEDTRAVGISFVIAVLAFALAIVTIPEAGKLGWGLITVQLLVANGALVANLVLFARLTTAQVMRSAWMPRF